MKSQYENVGDPAQSPQPLIFYALHKSTLLKKYLEDIQTRITVQAKTTSGLTQDKTDL